MTKRPLAAIGLIYLTVLAIAVCFASIINITLAIMAAIIGIAAAFFMRDYRMHIVIITIPIVLGFSVMSLCKNQSENIVVKLGDSECLISGEVTEIPNMQYGRWYYIIQTDYIGIDGAPQKIKIRLTSRNALEASEGDIIYGTVTFIQGSDENGYNSETSLRSDGIQARAWCSPYTEIDVTKGDTKLKYFPQKIRRTVTRSIRSTLPEKYSGMLCAMLLGDTTYLDDNTAENFRTTGIAHLLAVSGLHVSLLTYCVMKLLRRLHLPVKLNILLTMAFILLFMAVTGFSPSVTRAGIMHLMALLARLIMRDADNITSMSLSVLIMCIINPWSAADIGLQMSVSSTLGLILAAERINHNIQNKLNIGHFGFIPRLKRYIVESLVVSITASICTIPLSAVYFGRVSLIAPLTNILCVYAATVFMVIGMIAVIFSSIPLIGWLLTFLPKLAAILLGGYLDITTDFLASIPLASVNSGYDYVPWFFVFVAAIISAAFIAAHRINKPEFIRKSVLAAFCGVFALLLVSMISHQAVSSGGEIFIFDMQDGGTCVCAKKETHALISETGGSSYDLLEINDIFSREGIQKLDAAAVSDNSDSRSALADDLIEQYTPDYLALGGDIKNYAEATDAAEKSGTEIIEFGSEISLKKMGLSLKMYTDSLGNCWQMLNCEDTNVLICPTTGDCSQIPEDFRTCDIVVIGDSEVKNVIYLTAGAVVITAEEKAAVQIAAKLRVKGFSNVYMTSVDGTLKCRVKNGKLYIESY